MKAKTLEALRGSIAKWKAIADGTGSDMGGKNCPLCVMFAKTKECRGCPVFEHTGRIGCLGSPWNDWMELHTTDYPWKATGPNKKKAARAELKFLRSLLP